MQKRPLTTLFMLMTVDGKISTGATDELDVDKDFPKIDGIKEGLHQYYEIERTTDLLTESELGKLGVLKLERCDVLQDSYVRLRYEVIS